MGPSYFDSSVGGFSHSLQQLVILWVKCDGEGTVDDSSCRDANVPICPSEPTATLNRTLFGSGLHTVDVSSKIDLADVVVLQDGGVPSVRSVVGSAVVQGAASREGQAGVQPVLLYQLTRTVFQSLTWKTNDMKYIIQRTSAEPNQTPRSHLQRWRFHKKKGLTRCQSWPGRV